MRTAAITAPGHLTIGERPLPEPGPGQVRLAVGYCGVCGSDLHMRDSLPAGAVLGHEFAGTVAALGPGVDGWRIGDRAAVLIYENCGHCRFCRSGSENQCVDGGQHGDVLGVGLSGGFAEAVIANEGALFGLPDKLQLSHAALTEPVSIGVRAAAAVTVPVDDPVLVIGAGPIGLFTTFVLRARGRRSVYLVERNQRRAQVASRLGCETLSSDDLAGQLRSRCLPAPGAIVECAGSPRAAADAIGLLRRQGQLILVGLPSGPASLDTATIVLNEIHVRGASGCSRSDFEEAIRLLADGAIPAHDVITAVVDLAGVDAVFDDLQSPDTEHVKVLLTP